MKRSLPFILILMTFSIYVAEARLLSKADSICRNLKVNGLISLVIKDTSIIGNYIYGTGTHYQNGTVTEKRLENNDLWRIASVSKNVVSTAIMILRDCGAIDLDADVKIYLREELRNPEYPEIPITVRMLLSHRSSIAEGQFVLDSYNGVEFMSCKPGTSYNYSNINYLLLAQVIESITGERFDSYIQKNIFDKLNITGHFEPFSYHGSDLIYGKWYDRNNARLTFCDTYKWYDKTELTDYVLVSDTKYLDPAGGCIISPEDLSKYVMLHANNGRWNGEEIITEESEDMMRQPLSRRMKYGLGTIDYSWLIKGESLYGHTGYSLGIFSCIVYNPHRKFGFVILCNGAMIDYNDAFTVLHAPLIKLLYDCFIGM